MSSGVEIRVSVPWKPAAATGAVIHVINLPLTSLPGKIGSQNAREAVPSFYY